MQVTQADETSIRRRVGENLNNMKKILMFRSERTDTASPVSPDPQSLMVSQLMQPNLILERFDCKDLKPVVEPIPSKQEKKEVQPPLPPYPPPPNSPPNLNIVIKQEKEDEDETEPKSCGEGDGGPDPQPPSDKTPADGAKQRPKKTMCRDFIKGNCSRPHCKYAHEVDVSQLADVYTFCWNYQNAVCTFPNCKFVHASIFEEAEFYRTGVLPPHARAHMQKQKPPPPPEEPLSVETRPKEEFRATLHGNMPPPPMNNMTSATANMPLHHGNLASLPVNTNPLTRIAAPPLPGNTTLAENTPPKRKWNELEPFNSSPCDIDSESLAKKQCKNCDIVEFSFKYHKELFDNIIKSSEEIDKKMGQLSKKSHKLFKVLQTLLKPYAMFGKSSLNNGLMSGADKDKSLLDQLGLSGIVGSNRLLASPTLSDDSHKNMVSQNLNMSNLMKFLCNAGDTDLPGDSCRDT